jgi:hypothetical protein
MRKNMEDLSKYYEPKGVITIYKSNRSNSFYSEYSPVFKGKTLAPRPLAIKDLQNLANAIKKKKSEHSYRFEGFIPSNVIVGNQTAESYTLIWYNKPMSREIQVDKRKVTLELPWVIYVAKGKHLKVLMMRKEETIITEDTWLFDNPLPNTLNKNGICFGTVERRIPLKSSFEDLMKMWESYYWESKFTGNDLMQTILKKKQTFINDYLTPCKKPSIIQDLIDEEL